MIQAGDWIRHAYWSDEEQRVIVTAGTPQQVRTVDDRGNYHTDGGTFNGACCIKVKETSEDE